MNYAPIYAVQKSLGAFNVLPGRPIKPLEINSLKSFSEAKITNIVPRFSNITSPF